ncbi:MAG TPA: Mut7-C RNAse domain-containing protein [Parafilimonas sp.]|nr:Mut7-C RNAse domain-containing protein [Parafilimonas sp.]
MHIEYKFLADANVGKLARLLRMPGFDVGYNNEFSRRQLTEIAIREKRILLSRNPAADKLFPGYKALLSLIKILASGYCR